MDNAIQCSQNQASVSVIKFPSVPAAADLSRSASCHYNLVISSVLGDESPCVYSNKLP